MAKAGHIGDHSSERHLPRARGPPGTSVAGEDPPAAPWSLRSSGGWAAGLRSTGANRTLPTVRCAGTRARARPGPAGVNRPPPGVSVWGAALPADAVAGARAPGLGLYQCPGASIPHMPESGLPRRNVIPHGPGGTEPEIKVSAGWASSHRASPLRAYKGCLFRCLCVMVPLCPFLKDTGQMAPGARPKDPHVPSSALSNPSLQMQPHSQGPGTQASLREFDSGDVAPV